MPFEEHLSLLNPSQREAVTHWGSPLLILAGAGSGKTRVITTKIAYLIAERGYDPASILAVTFTKKAANEMAERAKKIDPRCERAMLRTFHSFGAWFLRRHAQVVGLDNNFTVYDDDDSASLLVKAVPSLDRKTAARYAHKISLAKDRCLFYDSPQLSAIDSSAEFPQIYASYERRLRGTGNVDFGDLIMLSARLLEKDRDVRARMNARFTCVMVDEYQDANTAQFRLLELLASNGAYVCVVGDDDQSIYRFRGAEVQNILSFQNHFSGTTIIRLEENYRSFAPILSVAQSVVENNEGRLGKTLSATRQGGSTPVLLFLPSAEAEAAQCAQIIAQSRRKDGSRYGDWAVLYRTNAQSLSFESEFLRAKIPYKVVGSLKFYEREEIKDTLAFLSFLANPRDEIAFRRIINKPPRGIGQASQEKIIECAFNAAENSGENSQEDLRLDSLITACENAKKTLSKKAAEGAAAFLGACGCLLPLLDDGSETRAASLSHLIQTLVTASGLSDYYEADDEISGSQRVSNLQELANSAAHFALSRQGLTEFLDHIDLDRALEIQNDENGNDAVTLITLHNTKGLEFPNVIITGLEKGIFPRPDKTGEELEEERRLFYVGITRARDRLIMTSCQNRRVHGRIERMEISPFLLEIDSSLLVTSGEKPRGFFYGTDARTESPARSRDFPWRLGAIIQHDEYGYGKILSSNIKEGELVISVRFESGAVKTFLPEYQRHSLSLVG
jgi:DNA helicase-2/ATP-dependent DNA helicase PcrA